MSSFSLPAKLSTPYKISRHGVQDMWRFIKYPGDRSDDIQSDDHIYQDHTYLAHSEDYYHLRLSAANDKSIQSSSPSKVNSPWTSQRLQDSMNPSMIFNQEDSLDHFVLDLDHLLEHCVSIDQQDLSNISSMCLELDSQIAVIGSQTGVVNASQAVSEIETEIPQVEIQELQKIPLPNSKNVELTIIEYSNNLPYIPAMTGAATTSFQYRTTRSQIMKTVIEEGNVVPTLKEEPSIKSLTKKYVKHPDLIPRKLKKHRNPSSTITLQRKSELLVPNCPQITFSFPNPETFLVKIKFTRFMVLLKPTIYPLIVLLTPEELKKLQDSKYPSLDKMKTKLQENNNSKPMKSFTLGNNKLENSDQKNRYISRLNIYELRDILELGDYHIQLTKEIEVNVLEIFKIYCGFDLGHQTWTRDTTKEGRIDLIDQLHMYTSIFYPEFNRIQLEVIVRRGSYAFMQNNLRKERRMSK